jgi:hypothetical protein
MAISERRQQEIIDLATPGVPPGTPERYWNDDVALDRFIRAADRKRLAWLKSATDPEELHCFAQNWHWDGGGGKPLQGLVANPHCDAGTMLMIFWLGSAEDSYYQFRTIQKIKWEFDREIFRLFRQIERKLVKGDYSTAKIPFDPAPYVSMLDRRAEFARAIPDLLYQPIEVIDAALYLS